MDPVTRSIDTSIWLEGNPVFSLTYKNLLGTPIYTDLTGFRPDPSDYLSKGKKYRATLTFHSEKDHLNQDQWVLRLIEPKDSNQKLVYIR